MSHFINIANICDADLRRKNPLVAAIAADAVISAAQPSPVIREGSSRIIPTTIPGGRNEGYGE